MADGLERGGVNFVQSLETNDELALLGYRSIGLTDRCDDSYFGGRRRAVAVDAPRNKRQ